MIGSALAAVQPHRQTGMAELRLSYTTEKTSRAQALIYSLIYSSFERS